MAITEAVASQIKMPTKSRVNVVGTDNWGNVAAKLIVSHTLKFESFHVPDLENIAIEKFREATVGYRDNEEIAEK
ncbi:hypothetical protein AgCh_004627 [Apium graveolens]